MSNGGDIRLELFEREGMAMKPLGKITLLSIALCALFLMGCDTDQLVRQIGSIQGVVLDETAKPVANASVTVDGSAYSTLTNVEGGFVLALPEGNWTLRIHHADSGELNDVVSVQGGKTTEGLSFHLVKGCLAPQGLELHVETQARSFEVGEAIPLRLTVRNGSDEACPLRFPSSQTHDFVVTDEEGIVLWKWSKEHAFLPLESTRTLAPGASWTLEAQWNWWEHPAAESIADRALELRARLCTNPALDTRGKDRFRLHFATETRQELSFELLAEGRIAGEHGPLRAAIRSADELEALRTRLQAAGECDDLDFPADVDFSQHMVLALVQGPTRNEEARIRVRSIEELDGRHMVRYESQDRWTLANSGQSSTGTAFQLVTVSSFADAPVFVELPLP